MKKVINLVLIRRTLLILSALFSFLLITGCATNPVTGDSNFVLMSEEQEIALGAKSNTQVMKQYTPYEVPELQNLVEKLGQELAANSHRSNLDFHFTVLDSPEVNAFALPGGYIYITRGIMAYMNNEEQLAGVLGHEIGHVTARHSVRQHSASTLSGLGGLVAAVVTGNREVAQAFSQIGGALVSGYGRNHELEADRLGAEYLARTGYDPELMLGVIGILKNQEEFDIQRAKEEGRPPRNYHGVFSTHPANDKRLQEVIRAADKFKNPDAERADEETFLRMLDGMVFGSSESQGITRGSRFYHKELDFTISFPDNWRIENQPNQLLAIRSDNNALIRVQIDDLKPNESPEQYARREFKGLKEGQRIGADAYSGLVNGTTPFGKGWVRVGAVFHGQHVFVLSGAAAEELPDRAFFQSIDSIRSLKRDEVELAKARHIKLIKARSGDTFASLAKQSNLGPYAEEQLRLLNDMYPEGEPRVGQTIKIIR